MTNPREALEEAFKVIFGPEPPSEYDGRAWTRNEPDFSPTWTAYIAKRNSFRRFLDAEAWTDAAMMLIPDNWTAWEMRSHAGRSHFSADLSRLSECDAGQEDWAHGRGMHPALALAEAALRAKEAGNGVS